MYQFTFARDTTGHCSAFFQRVIVTADSKTSARMLFESLYPHRHFVVFTCTHLPCS